MSERAHTGPLVEVDRIRWQGPAGEGRLLFSRFHEAATTEVQLLPFLSRKGLPVPRVVARGVPPSRAAERRPWLLVEDPEGIPLSERLHAEAGPRAASALRGIQVATAADEPALTALGVPALPASRIRTEALSAVDLLDRAAARRLRELADACDVVGLEALGVSLVHGDYSPENVVAVDDRVLVVHWLRAHLGCPLQDLARPWLELGRPDTVVADEAQRAYGGEPRLIDQAASLQRLFTIRWHAWEAQVGIRTKDDSAERVRALLAGDSRK